VTNRATGFAGDFAHAPRLRDSRVGIARVLCKFFIG
jgi:hypothetical protein